MTKTSSAPAPLPVVLAQFAAVYFILALAALCMPRQPGAVTALWFAGAVGTAYLLHHDGARAPALLACAALANFCARLSVGDALPLALTFATANTLEMALGAVLIRHTGTAEKFDESPEKYLHLLLMGACVSPVFGAGIGALALSMQGPASFSTIWPAWYASSMVGTIAVLPVALLVWRRRQTPDAPMNWTVTIAFALLTVLICLAALTYLPFPFLAVMAPLILAAVKLDIENTAIYVWLSGTATAVYIAAGYFDVAPALGISHLPLIYVPSLLVMLLPMTLAVSVRQGRLKDAARRHFEAALERNSRELQTIIDHMPSMVGYWDHEQKNRFGNRAYQDWFGFAPEHMRGKHMRTVIGEEHYASSLPQIEAALRGETPMFERVMVDQAGMARNTLVSYVPEFADGKIAGFYAFVTDITTVKRAQREQLEAQTQLQGVIDSASEFSIVATHLNGTIRVFSAGAERMLGYRADEVVDKHTPALLHDHDEVVARSMELGVQLGRPVSGIDIFVEGARHGQAEQREWTYVRKDGSRLAVNVVVSAIRDADNRITGYLGIANDITRQKQIDMSLLAAKEQAEAASRAKSQFVANMSHEIRTPLNAVLGMTHLLGNTSLSNDQAKYLDMIRVSGQALLSVLNDVLDFSKIEAGRMELAPEPFQLGELLSALATIMAVNAGEKDLELAIGVDADVPTALIGDALRLQQVLINLTHNAIKFTERGEVEVRVEIVRDAPNAGDGMAWLRFTVRDTGIGLDAVQQARLFSAFSQADASTTRRFGGSGLGLTISRRLIEMMNGSIEIRSALGAGSSFIVELPLAVSSGPAVSAKDPWRDLQMLVVAAKQTSRDCLGRSMRAWTQHVDSTGSGADALARVQALRTAGKTCDVALIDWQIPDMDGLDLMQALRALQADAPLTVVIMVSAFQRARLIEEAAAAQADAIMIKPVTGPGLRDALEAALAARGDQQNKSPFAPRGVAAQQRLDGARLLLVEDNHFNQIVAKGMLEYAGALVDVAENGRQALTQLRDADRPYDLVLMDVQMPVMDGFAATRAIRNELQMHLPVLAMTAGVMPSERAQCMESGMDDFIAKPIDPDLMLATIALHLPARLTSGKAAAPVAIAPPLASLPVSPPPAAIATPGSEPIFNPEPLMLATRNDPANREKIITLIWNVVERAPGQISAARTAWQEGRDLDAALIFHTLRGSIGTLGAKQFSKTTIAIENAILASHAEQIPTLFDAIERDLDITMMQARQWLEQYGARAAQAAPATLDVPAP